MNSGEIADHSPSQGLHGLALVSWPHGKTFILPAVSSPWLSEREKNSAHTHTHTELRKTYMLSSDPAALCFCVTVGADKQCELTCRPAGYRFYVRQSERVRDGTPCFNVSTNDVCVEGQCLVSGFKCVCEIPCFTCLSPSVSCLEEVDKAQNLAVSVSRLEADLNWHSESGSFYGPSRGLFSLHLFLFLSFALSLSDFTLVPPFCSWQESSEHQLPI